MKMIQKKESELKKIKQIKTKFHFLKKIFFLPKKKKQKKKMNHPNNPNVPIRNIPSYIKRLSIGVPRFMRT